MSDPYDHLIIGQGLAGSLLAWELIHRGQTVMVIDDGLKHSASKVAAGLINPLPGKRFNRPPETQLWLDHAHALYADIQKISCNHYFHSIDMLRLLHLDEQHRFMERQLALPDSHHFIDQILDKDELDKNIHAPLGGFMQKQTGYLDIPVLLDDLREWLITQNAYQQTSMNYSDIAIEDHGITLNDLHATDIIFCEGYGLRNNPWFQHLPLQPDKGEFFTLKTKAPLTEHIINSAHWILPTHDGNYRFGATHEHEQLDEQATEGARAQLQQGLDNLFKSLPDDLTIEQSAGVRPATSDRKPFIGTHPVDEKLKLFNGFGARGSLTIPWHAEHFVNHLLDQQPLNSDVDIARYAL